MPIFCCRLCFLAHIVHLSCSVFGEFITFFPFSCCCGCCCWVFGKLVYRPQTKERDRASMKERDSANRTKNINKYIKTTAPRLENCVELYTGGCCYCCCCCCCCCWCCCWCDCWQNIYFPLFASVLAYCDFHFARPVRARPVRARPCQASPHKSTFQSIFHFPFPIFHFPNHCHLFFLVLRRPLSFTPSPAPSPSLPPLIGKGIIVNQTIFALPTYKMKHMSCPDMKQPKDTQPPTVCLPTMGIKINIFNIFKS